MATTQTVKVPSGETITAREVSITEMLNDPIPDCNAQRADVARDVSRHSPDWFGGLTHVSQAHALLEGGWQQGAERVGALSRDLSASVPQIEAIKRRFVASDEGDELRIDQAIAGDWDRAWRRSRRSIVKGNSRTVDLVAFWGLDCDGTAEEIFWLGAASAAVCNILEEAGYSVRLSAAANTNHHTATHLSLIELKAPEVPLSVDLVAGTLCHAGVFRSLGFVEIARAPVPISSSFGLPNHSHAVLATYMAALGREDVVTVPKCTSKASAIKSINAVITQITGTKGE